MKPKFLDLRGMKTRIRKASDYIVEIVSEAYPMSEEDKQELRETIETEVYDLLDEIRQRIKSACEFYLRYKDNPELLIKEHPELKRKCKRLSRWAYESEYKPHSNMAEYNEWLFKLTFRGVFGEKNG